MCSLYSWTVLRSQCIAEDSSLNHAETAANRKTDSCHPSCTAEWCSDADDWDVDLHDTSTLCVGEVLAGDRHKLIDVLTCSTQTVLHNKTLLSSASPLPDAISGKPSDMSSSDEPVLSLQELTINDEVEKPVSTQHNASTNVQKCSVPGVQVELSNESCESTANSATQLEAYYIYVMDEVSVSAADHLGHVKDLLTKYTQQEGSSFNAELESGNCRYVGLDRFFVDL